jgi:hypothetical protein
MAIRRTIADEGRFGWTNVRWRAAWLEETRKRYSSWSPRQHQYVRTHLLVGALSDCLNLTFTLQAHQLHQVPRFVD